MPDVRLHPALLAVLLGILLALTFPPLPSGVLAPIVLAAVLWHASRAHTIEGVAGRLFWTAAAMSAVHLWWLTAFLGNLFQMPLMGLLAFALFAIEGGFYAVMGYLVARLIKAPLGRVWGLAGGWILLEWLRFMGPLAFPWPTLGYAFLDTPLIQIADLGGVLLVSVLISATAAALVSFWQGRAAPLWVIAVCWLAALSYGLTRTPKDGPLQPMLVTRSTFDAFGRATHQISPQEQFEALRQASLGRPADQVVVWSETALVTLPNPTQLPAFPGPGITGLGTPEMDGEPRRNSVIAIDQSGVVVSRNDKAKLVPFGEYFPLYKSVLRPIYTLIEQTLGISLAPIPAAQEIRPLILNGVRYGTYICYDSVFPWVARRLVQQGAELLVNPSNDGWYTGWGVRQHFMMGRVRAIETRRWLVRSVNEGVAGAVNDLGQPVNVVATGESLQTLSVQPKRLTGTSLFIKWGDWPALLLAAGMVGLGLRQRKAS